MLEVQRCILEVKELTLGPLCPGSPVLERAACDPGCWASCVLQQCCPLLANLQLRSV